jgi:hypothetical protein
MQARQIKFNGWQPTHAFYRFAGKKLGRVFTIRKYRGNTYVFRLE